MKRISINGTEYMLFGAGENTTVSIYPHMIEVSSGEIPKGKQLGLLKGFLEANGVTPIDNANTHWCVEAAMRIDSGNADVPILQTSGKIEDYKKLPLEQLRDEYGNYLIKQQYRQATINTSRTDAFYIWRNGSRELFWRAVEADDKTAENLLLGILAEKSSVDPRRNVSGYIFHLRLFRSFLDIKPVETAPATLPEKRKINTDSSVPEPSPAQVKHYLDLWDSLENYHLQEDALDRLFFELAPRNEDITDILLKASTLNDFYSTNIFSIFPVAKHIQSLHIDKRLKAGDATLVGEIQHLIINGAEKNFYSFATKYCSHHNPLEYPIYDSYVDRVLRHFRDRDGFAEFKNEELKNYARFKELLIQFREFYGLQEYDLKQIDKYIWQLGKDYFPKNYGK